MSDLFSYTKGNPPRFCLHCGDPIQQPRHGGRMRLYCKKPGCRKAGNRATIKREHEQAVHNLEWKLKKQWEQFDVTTRWTLEETLKRYGIGAASLATEAIQQELESRVRNPILQAQFARHIRQQMEVEQYS